MPARVALRNVLRFQCLSVKLVTSLLFRYKTGQTIYSGCIFIARKRHPCQPTVRPFGHNPLLYKAFPPIRRSCRTNSLTVGASGTSPARSVRAGRGLSECTRQCVVMTIHVVTKMDRPGFIHPRGEVQYVDRNRVGEADTEVFPGFNGGKQ